MARRLVRTASRISSPRGLTCGRRAFRPSTIKRNAAPGVAVRVGVRVSDVEVLDAVEREQVLVAWNGTAARVPAVTLPGLFEAQVARTPDAVALVFEGRSVSYGELNARANGVARLLVGRGVGPESLVAVMMDRSVDLVVSLLAVLKAGGAYVPIDPAYPAERIGYMLQDSQPVLALCDEAAGRTVTALVDKLPVVSLDDPVVVKQVACDASDVIDAERIVPLSLAHPAYVICCCGARRSSTSRRARMRSAGIRNGGCSTARRSAIRRRLWSR